MFIEFLLSIIFFVVFIYFLFILIDLGIKYIRSRKNAK